MIKVEEIEKMATVLSSSNETHGLGLKECKIDLLAIDLYEKGYRKIDNDRYLDRKEYANFVRLALEGCAEENIKSTAKEILTWIKHNLWDRFEDEGDGRTTVYGVWNDELAEKAAEYDVEIEK